MKKQLSLFLRRLRLLPYVDQIRLHWQQLRMRAKNQRFKDRHPDICLPEDAIMYETFGLDYEKYYRDGLQTARWILDVCLPYLSASRPTIFDWGCGPARVVRHLPSLIPEAKAVGADFNAETIAWCQRCIGGVRFYHNRLSPPLPLDAAVFDLIYGISVLTHLSGQHQQHWLAELKRVLRPGGVLLLTTQGAAFREKLLRREQALFDRGQVVVRGRTAEGRRSYSTFQPASYMQNLFSDFTILQHLPGARRGGKAEQDVWIVCKK